MSTLLADGKNWELKHTDCIQHMLESEMPEKSVDFCVYSPPFPAMYAYNDSEADLGNVEDLTPESLWHFKFFFNGMLRVMKPGRVMVVHCCQIPRMKRCGGVGMHDFRGMLIRLGERAGFIYEYDWAIRKNPQALKHGTGVLTPSGYVPIEKLKVGDEVIGSNGKPTRVKGVYPHGARQMYRVAFSDGASTECDGRHLWQVETVNGPSKTMTTDDIRSFGVTSPGGDRRFKIPMLSASVRFADGEPLPIDPYTLGAIIGDGSTVSRGSVFVTTEREIVDAFQPVERHKWSLTKHGQRGGTVCTQTVTCDDWHVNKILEAVRQLGLEGKRSWEKFVPQSYLLADAYTRLEVLRGLMDTDGTIKTRSGIVCKFCTTSEQLAKDVQFLAESLGGVARMDTEDNSRYSYRGEMRNGRRKYLVSLRMPSGCNPFKMARKADRWKPAKKSVCRWIASIEPTEIADCTCIEVEAEDHLYVIEHCIVTHNSQAIRTRSRELQFVGLEKDRSKSRGAIADYLIKFIAPGTNAVPIRDPEDIPILNADGTPRLDENGRPMFDDSRRTVTRDNWIDWAEPAWMDIRETDTLRVRGTKEEDDTRHICPLQKSVIERLVRLYSNPGEVVFSPFAGIGSEGVVSLEVGRRFYGCELKKSYYLTACTNLRLAEEAVQATGPRLRVESSRTVPRVADVEPVEILDEPEFDEDALPVETATVAEPEAAKPKKSRGRPRKADAVAPVEELATLPEPKAEEAPYFEGFFDSMIGGIVDESEAEAFDKSVDAATPVNAADPLDTVTEAEAEEFDLESLF